MFFPLGTDRRLSRPTLVNHLLMALNVGVFVAMAFLAQTDKGEHERVLHLFWLFPSGPANPAGPHPWSFVTYAFLHHDLMHILGNMLFLWVFGPNVEDRFGRIGYPLFYLTAGAGAGALHAFFSDAPVIGASGAIAGVTGAFLVLFPHTHVKTLVFFFYVGIFAIPAAWFIGARIAWDIWTASLGHAGNVATLAHIGGYTYGIALSMLLLWTRLLAREPYDLFTISRQASRRRQFREVAYQQRQKAAAPPASAAPEIADAVATARAEVSRCVSAMDMPAAAAAYKKLLGEHGATPGACTLSRRHQYDLANHLFQSGDYQTAAEAYERFLAGYPNDPEASHVKLLLGRINARYLNDPVEAKRLLGEVISQLRDEDSLALAKRELADLG